MQKPSKFDINGASNHKPTGSFQATSKGATTIGRKRHIRSVAPLEREREKERRGSNQALDGDREEVGHLDSEIRPETLN